MKTHSFKQRPLAIALAATIALGSSRLHAADVEIRTPPGGNFAVRDSTGAILRLLVNGTTGEITVPYLTAAPQQTNVVCFQTGTGLLGQCAPGSIIGPQGSAGCARPAREPRKRRNTGWTGCARRAGRQRIAGSAGHDRRAGAARNCRRRGSTRDSRSARSARSAWPDRPDRSAGECRRTGSVRRAGSAGHGGFARSAGDRWPYRAERRRSPGGRPRRRWRLLYRHDQQRHLWTESGRVGRADVFSRTSRLGGCARCRGRPRWGGSTRRRRSARVDGRTRRDGLPKDLPGRKAHKVRKD